jgi:acyl carrier protein
MTPDRIRAVLLEELGNIAPEADLGSLDPGADLREALDLDSMDLLNWIAAIHTRLGVNVPERDYAKLATLADAVDYLAHAAEKGGRSAG